MNRLFSALLFVILAGGHAYADYEPILLPELIKQSDLIIEGNLLSVYGKYISFKLASVLKGNYPKSTIMVDRFED